MKMLKSTGPITLLPFFQIFKFPFKIYFESFILWSNLHFPSSFPSVLLSVPMILLVLSPMALPNIINQPSSQTCNGFSSAPSTQRQKLMNSFWSSSKFWFTGYSESNFASGENRPTWCAWTFREDFHSHSDMPMWTGRKKLSWAVLCDSNYDTEEQKYTIHLLRADHYIVFNQCFGEVSKLK